MKRLPLNNFGSALVFGLLLFTSLTMVSCSESTDDPMPNNDNDPDQMANNGSGDAAPSFELTALNGNTVKSSDFEDKVVVLFFLL